MIVEIFLALTLEIIENYQHGSVISVIFTGIITIKNDEDICEL